MSSRCCLTPGVPRRWRCLTRTHTHTHAEVVDGEGVRGPASSRRLRSEPRAPENPFGTNASLHPVDLPFLEPRPGLSSLTLYSQGEGKQLPQVRLKSYFTRTVPFSARIFSVQFHRGVFYHLTEAKWGKVI